MSSGIRHEPVAGRAHFLAFLCIVAIVLAAGVVMQIHLSGHHGGATPAHPDRLRFYLLAAAIDWLLLIFCWYGVRRKGGTLGSLIGGRWSSTPQVVRDIAIAAAFWGLMAGLIWLGSHQGGRAATHPAIMAILPQTPAEIAAWIVLSLTAGFCEEAVFRGYVQKQLRAYCRNVILAVILQAAIFGLVHAYQGVQAAVGVTVLGVMFGTLAAICRSLRPGMIAHAWQDMSTGLLSPLFVH